jgi:hypothetical protein
MARVVEYLLSQGNALSSIPSTAINQTKTKTETWKQNILIYKHL